MSKRDKVQQEALEQALSNQRVGLGISMGVGKTLIGLRYLQHFWEKGEMVNALIVAPKTSIFQSWKDDAIKFSIDPKMMDNIEFTTYLSLPKRNLDYSIVILDECHSLLYSHKDWLTNYTGKILGLTGTPPRYKNSEKGEMVAQFCPIKYKYITDDAVDDEILNDYRIIVHRMPLSSRANILVKLKDKEFYTSEVKNYNYWSSRFYDANTPKQRQIVSVMRMRALMDFKTKETYVKKLLEDIEEKCIVFANTQQQADRISKYSVHSGNFDADENLMKFKLGEINKLSCVLQLNEGVNIPELRVGIIMHAYGNERKSNQRLGRLLRLNPDETAIIHVLCYKNTIDENWVGEALKDLDQSKIKYFDINEPF